MNFYEPHVELENKHFFPEMMEYFSEEEKQDLSQLPLEPLNELRILEFMSLYNEDGMAHIIKNTEFWLKDTFSKLTYDS